MSDRELLELAARAVGYRTASDARNVWIADSDGTRTVRFCPLDDSGQAFALAVDLDLNVFHAANCAYAMPSEDDGSNEQRVSYAAAGGKYKATRLAIVRAAAEIGRAALAQEGS
ncbi:hypothetical protein ABRZ04_05385 [Castellaniella ginsengisoli]|uniref:DUF2591 domain-containing protein n=1 Tax=Castellaniella ginsengisoli TaxID=546114 RepID=A0AB39D272_9BURK